MRHFFLLIGLFGTLGALSIEEMTLEEKVGQLLLVHFQGEQVNEAAKTLIEEIKVGGFVYYEWSNALYSPKQIRALSQDLQALATIPLFIAVDEEGGPISRLHSGFSVIPSNKEVGDRKNPDIAKRNALMKGKEIRAVGINLNFAPVVDIFCNPYHTWMKNRSFGSTPEIVSAFAEKALEGWREAGVIATLKHYPGHGDVKGDSHFSLPVLSKSLPELEKIELVPYATLSQNAEAVMTGHLFVPALDDENCTTLSPKTLNYLRENLGFQGVIISDSLVMEGVLQNQYSVEEAAVSAFNAGCDLLLLGGKAGAFELVPRDIQHIHAYFLEAVKTGRVSESRLNEALSRILHLKEKYLRQQGTTG